MTKWFRIELDKTGAILRCAEVESASRGTAHVRYVEAIDAAAACSFVKSWYERYRASANKSTRRYQAKLEERGGCARRRSGCTGDPEPGKISCRVCLDARARYQREHHSRRSAGDESDRRFNPGGPAAVMASAMSRNREGQARLRAKLGSTNCLNYRRCLREFDARGPELFRAWLVAKIEALTPKQPEQQAEAAE